MYEVYYTSREKLNDPTLVQALDNKGIPERMPFLIDSETYDYPEHINAFLRSLPTSGAPSPGTWKKYATYIALWCRYLEEHRAQPDPLQATREDAEIFYRTRRIVDKETAVSATTWNTSTTVLGRLYTYWQEKKLCTINPFLTMKSFSYQGVQVYDKKETMRERSPKSGTMTFHSMDEYLYLRDRGVRGLNADGTTNPEISTRNVVRDYAYCELSVSTGMRVQECNSLTWVEMKNTTQLEETSTAAILSLPPSITKNRKARKIVIPYRILNQVLEYVEIERETLVDKANENGRYDKGNWTLVTKYTRKGVQLESGVKLRWDQVDPSMRARLLYIDSSGRKNPLALWLSLKGLPTTTLTWTHMLILASERCEQSGRPIQANPHKFRHTFAVHMLNFLENNKKEGNAIYTGDSLRTVQLLMGHSSLETTNIYLGTVDLMSETLDVAAEDFARTLEGAIS